MDTEASFDSPRGDPAAPRGAVAFEVVGFLEGIAVAQWGKWGGRAASAHTSAVPDPLEWARVALADLFDRDFYNAALRAKSLEEVPVSDIALSHWIDVGRLHGIVASPVFDEAFYLELYPEVADANMRGFEHFVQWGVWEERAPNPLFDPAWYSASLANRTMPTFLHYLAIGAAAGKAPCMLIDEVMRTWQMGQSSRQEAAEVWLERLWSKLTWRPEKVGEEPVSVWLQCLVCRLGLDARAFVLLVSLLGAGDRPPRMGPVERMKLGADDLVAGIEPPILLFDPGIYLEALRKEQLPAPAEGESVLLHWLRHGNRRGIVPIPMFDTEFYLRSNPDVASADYTPYEHFCRYGAREGRDPNPFFNSHWYWSSVPTGTQVPSFVDYLRVVQNDTRMPSGLAVSMLLPLVEAGLAPEAISSLARDIQTAMCAFRLSVQDIGVVIDCFYRRESETSEDGSREHRHGVADAAHGRWIADAAGLSEYFRSGIWNHSSPTILFDDATYANELASLSVPVNDGESLDFAHWIKVGRERGINPSPFFDDRVYLAEYPDVENARTAPFQHFLQTGLREGRIPGLWFAPAWYEHQGATDPSRPTFINYLESGLAAQLAPAPWLSNFLGRYPVSAGGIDQKQYRALVAATRRLPRSLSSNELGFTLAIFDPDYVREQLGVAPDWESIDLLIAFFEGLRADLSPSRMFDGAFYRKLVRAEDLPWLLQSESSFLHWLGHGRPREIIPTPKFDAEFYARTYLDVPSGFFEHFLLHGLNEGRLPGDLAPILLPAAYSSRDRTQLLNARLFGTETLLDSPGRERLHRVPVAELEARAAAFVGGSAYRDMLDEAAAYDPLVGGLNTRRDLLFAPYCDNLHFRWRQLTSLMPAPRYDFVVCIPWMRMGGADLVGSLVVQSLRRIQPSARVLILQTDRAERDWSRMYPDDVDHVDISPNLLYLREVDREFLLFSLLRGLEPHAIFNVNSNLCWRVFSRYGSRVGAAGLFSYLFCWDQTVDGMRVGYPSDFFADTIGKLAAALTDTHYLKDELQRMYVLPRTLASKVIPIYTPAASPPEGPTIAERQLEKMHLRERPAIVWAGRLDRQKRFDIVTEVADAMPDVDFLCWGAAVLDTGPDLDDLPSNIHFRGTFRTYDELNLEYADGFLYTSAWDGLPTILIELAVRGVPIVASAVGGVPELITSETGWLITGFDPPDYVASLREMIAAPAERCRRAGMLRDLAATRHTTANFDQAISELLRIEALA